jgi:FkbM family methyltransferase
VIRNRLKYWLYGSCPGLSGSFTYFGTRVRFPRGAKGFQVACEQGIFEAANVRLIRNLVKPNTTYFDIGANIGLMAVPILHGCPQCSVVSFEPSPNTIPYLQRTIADSPFKSRWTMIPRALSDSQGDAPFYLASKELSMFDGLRDTRRVIIGESATVEVSTVDAEWIALGRPVVSVIKCDVEGNEFAILKGAEFVLERDRPFVLVEWNVDNLRAYDCDPTVILKLSSKRGYRVLALPNLIEISSPADLALHMTLTESFLLAPS